MDHEKAEIDLSRTLSEQLFSRAAGAELIAGNSVKLLTDARENYPAWISAIRSAKKTIFFESYIIYDDGIGNQFADLLCARSREGVRVRVIYDWLGGVGKSSRRYWQRLRNAGVEVRCFNPPRFGSPLSWFSRDHRKMITVDGEIGFVSGLCVGQKWIGDPSRSIEPWRDTGVEIRGPAVAALEQSFGEVWEATGAPFPGSELRERETIQPEGTVSLRVVSSVPTRAGLYRFDQLLAGIAREYLWLTDAYFVPVTPFVQTLKAAVEEGVDVRLLVPGMTDIPMLQALSRVGYKPLLEAGIRIFEWNGTMLHAKTAVADRKWARVGSTNLNFSSWIGNYELDVTIEDAEVARRMESAFLEDLTRSTEIVLGERYRLRPIGRNEKERRSLRTPGSASASQVGAGAIRLGSVVGSIVKNRKIHGPAGVKIMLGIGIFLITVAGIGLMWPRVVTIPLALILIWFGGLLTLNAYRLRKRRPEKPD